MSELKPCPWCHVVPSPLRQLPGQHANIKCISPECPVHPGVSADTPEEAARLWNTRPAPDRSAEEAALEIVQKYGATWPTDDLERAIAAALTAREAGLVELIDELPDGLHKEPQSEWEKGWDAAFRTIESRFRAALRAREEGKNGL